MGNVKERILTTSNKSKFLTYVDHILTRTEELTTSKLCKLNSSEHRTFNGIRKGSKTNISRHNIDWFIVSSW